MDRKKFLALVVSAVLGWLCGCSREDTEDTLDASTDASPDADTAAADWVIWRTLRTEAEEYARTHIALDYQGAFVAWIMERVGGGDQTQNRFYGPFVKARRLDPSSRVVKLLFKYEEGREDFYNPPFPGGTFEEREREHFRVIGELLNKVFTDRWNFQLFSEGLGNEITPEEADVVVFLGWQGDFSFISGKEIRLIQDGTLPHELLHWLWFWHHYIDWPELPTSDRSEHPPGEGPCTMARDGGLLGHLERFILRVEYDEGAAARLASITAELSAHERRATPEQENSTHHHCGVTEDQMNMLVATSPLLAVEK